MNKTSKLKTIGGYRTKGSKDKQKRCTRGFRRSKATGQCEPAQYIVKNDGPDNTLFYNDLIDELSKNQRSEATVHRKVYRPWGAYDAIDDGERFQVKRLFVHPGKKLSLQKHHHRAEHWVCVRGAAEVTIDDKVTILHELGHVIDTLYPKAQEAARVFWQARCGDAPRPDPVPPRPGPRPSSDSPYL